MMPAYPVLLAAGGRRPRTVGAVAALVGAPGADDRAARERAAAVPLSRCRCSRPTACRPTWRGSASRSNPASATQGRPAAALRGHVRLGHAGRRRGARRADADAGRTGDGAHLRAELRGGRRARVLRPITRSAAGDLRPQRLLALGTRSRQRRRRHHRRRRRRRSSRGVSRGRPNAGRRRARSACRTNRTCRSSSRAA